MSTILDNLRAIHTGLISLHNGLCPARPAHLPHPGQCAARMAAMREHCREIREERRQLRLWRERENRHSSYLRSKRSPLGS